MKIKRLRGFKLTQQPANFGYWWYGDKRINISLTTQGPCSWRLVVEFHLAEVAIYVEGNSEKKVRLEFSRRLWALKKDLTTI
jgi:hypothetical protein